MKKNLADAATVDEVIQRFSTLTLNNNSLWGTMLVTEMLLHCAFQNAQASNYFRTRWIKLAFCPAMGANFVHAHGSSFTAVWCLKW